MAFDPQTQQLLAAFAESGAPPLPTLTPEQARQPPVTFEAMIGPGPSVPVVRNIEIPGPAGPIPARL